MANANEEIRRRNKDAAQHAALFWIQLANERESELIRQLLGLSAVLLPLSASIVISNVTLGILEKHLLISSWVLLFVSMAAGYIQIRVDSKYFVTLSRDSSTREELWSNSSRSVPAIEKDVIALGKTLPQSTTIPQNIQAVTFFLGLILIILTGALLLFKSTPANNSSILNKTIHEQYWKLHRNRFNWR